mmetsp:Transcript_43500/g.86350  ORF Transcript_43500/g.86350 Transcript_43500/m.86350 type:complete len:209 (+) Transcript_43500:199-825(+)
MILGSARISKSLKVNGKHALEHAMQRGVHPSSIRGVLMHMPPFSLPSVSICRIRQASLKLSRDVISHTKCKECKSRSCRRGTPQLMSCRNRSSEVACNAWNTACATYLCKSSPGCALLTTERSSSRSMALAASTRACDVFTTSCHAIGSSSFNCNNRIRSSSSSSTKSNGSCAKSRASEASFSMLANAFAAVCTLGLNGHRLEPATSP